MGHQRMGFSNTQVREQNVFMKGVLGSVCLRSRDVFMNEAWVCLPNVEQREVRFQMLCLRSLHNELEIS